MERIHNLQGLVSRRILLWKHARRLKSWSHHHHRHEQKRHVLLNSSSSQHGRRNQTKWLNNNNNVISIINGRSYCETHLLPDCLSRIGQKASSCLYPAAGDLLSTNNEKTGLVGTEIEKRGEGRRRHFLTDQINIVNNSNNYFYPAIGKKNFSTVSSYFLISYLPPPHFSLKKKMKKYFLLTDFCRFFKYLMVIVYIRKHFLSVQ